MGRGRGRAKGSDARVALGELLSDDARRLLHLVRVGARGKARARVGARARVRARVGVRVRLRVIGSG